MFGVVCPQCKKPSDGPSSRLVQDCCGHQKCRRCLLLDEQKCLQCESDEGKKESVIKVISCNEDAHINDLTHSTLSNGAKYDQKLRVNGNEKSTKKRNYRSIVVPNHVSILKDPLQYKCNICSKTFTTKSHIKYHIYCTGGNITIFLGLAF